MSALITPSCPHYPLFLDTLTDTVTGTQYNPLPNPRIPPTLSLNNRGRSIRTTIIRLYGKPQSGHGKEVRRLSCRAG